MLSVTTVTTQTELGQILQLQQENLIRNISAHEIKSQGFVTLQHSIAELEQMHALAPSIIVKDNDSIAGYALVMHRSFRELFPPLVPMFNTFDKLVWKGKPLYKYNFYVMGQICIAKQYRGKGLVELLYHKHREVYQSQFDFVVTEIALRNHRSMRAHERIGFTTIHTHKDELDEWAVVLWDWH